MTTLKTFAVAPEQDSVRTAFRAGQRATASLLGLEKSMASHPEYVLKQDGVRVAVIRGKEMVCGGEHFAVIPFLPADWAEQGSYTLSNANVPYWDGEQRLSSLDLLLYNLSQGWTIPAALDDAVDAEDDPLFAGIPEVAYTSRQPEDYPLPQPLEWEPEPEPTPPAGRAAQPRDEWFANQHTQHTLQHVQAPAYIGKIYPWTFWYRGPDGASHQVILEATYEDAQRVWDKLITTLDITSKRP